MFYICLFFEGDCVRNIVNFILEKGSCIGYYYRIIDVGIFWIIYFLNRMFGKMLVLGFEIFIYYVFICGLRFCVMILRIFV